jgi:4-amino-4-deoxy-L-arabinose transferase-like glycosyltransferase
MASIKKLIRDNWLITLIIFSAAILRSWDLSASGILFGDAAKDLLVAKQAVESNNIPLLGIPSSIPRFHQGPLTVWLEMIIYSIFGQNTLVFSLSFAFIGILAVIAVYEYCVVYINKKTALVASALLAFSPLAVAHSRVPYHTNPIPFVIMIYLFSLQHLWQRKRLGVFWAGLTWVLVMQFELTLFSLGLIIPYILWRRKIKINIHLVSQLCAALLFGLLPQIIHDLTHSFPESQIGGFILWVGYRITALTGLVGDHQFSIAKLIKTFSIFEHYLSKIFSAQNIFISLIFLGLFITTSILVWGKRKNIKTGLKIPVVALTLITISYLAHGAPSEAYFPPYFPLLSIFIGWGLTQLFHKKEKVLAILVVGWAMINVSSIFRHSFFVSNPQAFSYNASLQEQRQIIKTINQIGGGSYELLTTHPAGKFPSYFDNMRWLAGELEIPKDQPKGMVFYIEPKGSRLSGYPDITIIKFNTYDVFYR